MVPDFDDSSPNSTPSFTHRKLREQRDESRKEKRWRDRVWETLSIAVSLFLVGYCHLLSYNNYNIKTVLIIIIIVVVVFFLSLLSV